MAIGKSVIHFQEIGELAKKKKKRKKGENGEERERESKTQAKRKTWRILSTNMNINPRAMFSSNRLIQSVWPNVMSSQKTETERGEEKRAGSNGRRRKTICSSRVFHFRNNKSVHAMKCNTRY